MAVENPNPRRRGVARRRPKAVAVTETPPPAAAPDLLVIGYGNTLRRDDGAGPRVAEAVAALKLPGVRTIACHQLSPEQADDIARARAVIFVDASVEAPAETELRRIEPGETTQLMAHAADPRTMLALARDVFGHAPRAWLLTIPVVKMGFGETLAPETQHHLEKAVHQIECLYRETRES
jgi:hydrogenase maturation protease